MSAAVPAIPAARELWLRGVGSRAATATTRVFCFHHAGGSASSYQLGRYFTDDVEVCAVQLPGRENRLAEPPATDLAAVADELAAVLASTVDLPYALFGHSMGALIAFEVARRLVAAGHPAPAHLFASAHRAPHLPDAELLHGLPDEELAARMVATNPLLEDADLRAMFLPILRADLTLCETYAYRPGPPLPCPITVFGGREDEIVGAAQLPGWGEHTAAGCRVRVFPGGHFYLRGAETVVVHHIRRALAAG